MKTIKANMQFPEIKYPNYFVKRDLFLPRERQSREPTLRVLPLSWSLLHTYLRQNVMVVLTPLITLV